jgi:hypothetical protein
MAHVKTYIEKIDSWLNACPCDKEIKDMNSFHYYLNNEYGL